MFHGLDNRFLYVAYRVVVAFKDDKGTTLEVTGTGFFVQNSQSQLCFVTNRHVLELAYADPKYLNFRLTRIELHGKAPTGEDKLPDVDQTIRLKPTGIVSHQSMKTTLRA